VESEKEVGEIMGGIIKARYQDKVLKPLGELDLKEGDEVEIKVRGSATSRIVGIVKCWEGLEEEHENYETNVH
jgi:predicted DNA-binding antitoxin AbrB/MazE fold protein